MPSLSMNISPGGVVSSRALYTSDEREKKKSSVLSGL